MTEEEEEEEEASAVYENVEMGRTVQGGHVDPTVHVYEDVSPPPPPATTTATTTTTTTSTTTPPVVSDESVYHQVKFLRQSVQEVRRPFR